MLEDVDDALRELAVEERCRKYRAIGKHRDDVAPLTLSKLTQLDRDDLIEYRRLETSRRDADIVDEPSRDERNRIREAVDDGLAHIGNGIAPKTSMPRLEHERLFDFKRVGVSRCKRSGGGGDDVVVLDDVFVDLRRMDNGAIFFGNGF